MAAIEAGFPQREIERRAFEHQRAVEEKRRVIVGENAFADPDASADEALPLHQLDPADEQNQQVRLQRFRQQRDGNAVRQSLDSLSARARGPQNLVPAILDAVKSGCTLGEISDVLRGVFGEHRPH